MATKTSFRSGELARLAGVSTDTLRHYERKKVLAAPRRAPNGYREYPAQALDRVRLVRRALTIGSTLDEFARILQERDHGRLPCRQVRELAAVKLTEIETQLSELVQVRDELRAILHDWDVRLEHATSGKRAGLLEALAANNSSAREDTSARPRSWTRRKRGG